MTRIKRGKIGLKRRRNVLKQTKGFRHSASTKERAAKDALLHAGSHARAHRRDKKGDIRRIWNVRINAALESHEMSYSKFMGELKKRGIMLDRKVLSTLANDYPQIFTDIVKLVK